MKRRSISRNAESLSGCNSQVTIFINVLSAKEFSEPHCRRHPPVRGESKGGSSSIIRALQVVGQTFLSDNKTDGQECPSYSSLRSGLLTKKIILIVTFISIVCTGCTFLRFDKEREIARNGKSKYSIVISGDASLSTIHGALELQMFLHTMTGAVLPIHSDRLPMKSREIMLGVSEHLRQLMLTSSGG